MCHLMRTTDQLEGNGNMTIERIPLAKLAAIVAALVKEGLTFHVRPHAHYDEWTITLTGGF